MDLDGGDLVMSNWKEVEIENIEDINEDREISVHENDSQSIDEDMSDAEYTAQEESLFRNWFCYKWSWSWR